MLLARSLATLAVLAFATQAGATTITYTATDLPDEVPGEDLWRYSYAVAGTAFSADSGFDIFFDPSLYQQLDDPPPAVNADWDVIAFQPDLALPDDGIYDALALIDAASLADPFVVDFVYLGTGTPGAQPFEIFDSSFVSVESGTTTPVPEPATSSLLAIGLALATLLARRGSRRSTSCDLPPGLIPLRQLAFVGVVAVSVAPPTLAQEVTGQVEVVALHQVSKRRVDRRHWEYTFQASVENAGPALTGVVATASSSSGATIIVDPLLELGDLAPGLTRSSETFSLRQNRSVPFDPSSISWTSVGTPALNAATIYADPLDPRLATFAASDGTSTTWLGRKSSDGSPVAVSGLLLEGPDVSEMRASIDEASGSGVAWLPSGERIVFEEVDGEGLLTFIDGESITGVRFPTGTAGGEATMVLAAAADDSPAFLEGSGSARACGQELRLGNGGELLVWGDVEFIRPGRDLPLFATVPLGVSPVTPEGTFTYELPRASFIDLPPDSCVDLVPPYRDQLVELACGISDLDSWLNSSDNDILSLCGSNPVCRRLIVGISALCEGRTALQLADLLFGACETTPEVVEVAAIVKAQLFKNGSGGAEILEASRSVTETTEAIEPIAFDFAQTLDHPTVLAVTPQLVSSPLACAREYIPEVALGCPPLEDGRYQTFCEVNGENQSTSSRPVPVFPGNYTFECDPFEVPSGENATVIARVVENDTGQRVSSSGAFAFGSDPDTCSSGVPEQANVTISDTVSGWAGLPGTPVISGLTEDSLNECAGERLSLGVPPEATLYRGLGTGPFPYIPRSGYISIQAARCDSFVAIKDFGLPTQEVWLRGTHRRRSITNGTVRSYETRYHEGGNFATRTMVIGESFGGSIPSPIEISSFSVTLDFVTGQ